MICTFKPNSYDPKDWQCPKPSCRAVNFKKRTTCVSCGARKPDGKSGPLSDWRDGDKHEAVKWDCAKCKQKNEAGTYYCLNPKCKQPSELMEKLMEADKLQRQADEGRGGGLYDRQDPNDKKAWDSDEEEFDEFGRRKTKKAKKYASDDAASKADAKKTATADKHKAALERLKKKHAATPVGSAGNSAGASSRGRRLSRSRSRSRSRRR